MTSTEYVAGLFDLTGHVGIITGGSRGLGFGQVKVLTDAGAAVYNLDLIPHSDEQMIREGHLIDIRCDVTDYDAVEKVVKGIVEKERQLDFLINNAGISYIGLLTDMSIDDWNHIVSTNLTSVFSTSRLAIPHMVHEKKGKIINISSVWGIAGASCEVAYSACKGGINSFTKALAKELAPSNIQVNAIACGVIDTQMNACFSEEERKELADEIPAGRFGTPEEVAHLAVQLANGNDYLTGQIITLDGGWL